MAKYILFKKLVIEHACTHFWFPVPAHDIFLWLNFWFSSIPKAEIIFSAVTTTSNQQTKKTILRTEVEAPTTFQDGRRSIGKNNASRSSYLVTSSVVQHTYLIGYPKHPKRWMPIKHEILRKKAADQVELLLICESAAYKTKARNEWP